MRERCHLAHATVKTKPDIGIGLQGDDLGDRDFVVEDWCENVLGRSWMCADGNPAALEYAIRSAGRTPIDNEVVYGKIGGLGHLIHMDELVL